MCKHTHIHTYTYVAIINEKRHEFERHNGGVYGKVWKVEGKGEMM